MRPRRRLVPVVGWPIWQKALLIALVVALLAYVTRSLTGLLIFGSLAWCMSLGRSVPLGALAAVLLGACFPYVGLAVCVIGLVYVIVTPTGGPARNVGVPG